MSKLYTSLFLLMLINKLFANNNEYVIEIDNPKFRKISVAIPNPIKNISNDSFKIQDKDIRSKMTMYLSFTGLFRTMDYAAYRDIKIDSISTSNFIRKSKHLKWKDIGVDCLVLTQVKSLAKEKYRIMLRAIDINKGKNISSYTFSIENKNIKTVNFEIEIC